MPSSTRTTSSGRARPICAATVRNRSTWVEADWSSVLTRAYATARVTVPPVRRGEPAPCRCGWGGERWDAWSSARRPGRTRCRDERGRVRRAGRRASRRGSTARPTPRPMYTSEGRGRETNERSGGSPEPSGLSRFPSSLSIRASTVGPCLSSREKIARVGRGFAAGPGDFQGGFTQFTRFTPAVREPGGWT